MANWYEKYMAVYGKPFSEVPDNIIKCTRERLARLQSQEPLASIVVIAYNEETHLQACLWALSEMQCKYPVEIIGVDNDSRDRTAEVFEKSGIPYYTEYQHSCGYARRQGLQHARGRFYVDVDSDTIYPPQYFELMIEQLLRPGVSCVSATWSYFPDARHSRLSLRLFEMARDMFLWLQHFKRPELSVRGLVFAYNADYGRREPYRVDIIRGEDGSMALNLKKYGKIVFLRDSRCRAITGYGTIGSQSMWQSFVSHVRMQLRGIGRIFHSTVKYTDQADNLVKQQGPRRRMPAEWEQQTAVQLTWPHSATDWAPMLDDITDVYTTMAHEIQKRERLVVVAPEGVELPATVTADVLRVPTDDTWARDHGFITVEEDGRKLLLDFCFNGWGEKFPAAQDNAINRRLHDAGMLQGSYESHLDFVLEGGSIESDGRGTVFTTACCLLAPHRNQPLTQKQIDARLRELLGAERVVWLQHGSLIGDDTDGHIDTLMRICPDDTIVYTGDDDDHPDLLLMEQELKQLRTINGMPYRLLRLPLPAPVFDGDDRLPATYANYLVLNGAVLVPTYSQPEQDRQALAVVGQAYPDREIVGVDCRAIIRQHGSLHCCTMQYYPENNIHRNNNVEKQ